MPSPSHPRRRDFYVYVITAAGLVFYVGIGRAARASDRLRWVQSQMDREKRGLPGHDMPIDYRLNATRCG